MTAASPDVWIIDASALIDTKRMIAPQHQWGFLERLKLMVQAGVVCFPKQVRDELHTARHVDTPEAWALDVCGLVTRSYIPNEQTLEVVMRAAPGVVDADAEGEPADPYVIAQALEIQETGVAVCVVTDDLVDRVPLKIALSTACGLLNVPWCDLSAFMQALGFDPRTGWP